MPDPVLVRLDPIAGESLMSLSTRVAVRNILPSSHVILEQVGAPHAQNPTVAITPSLDRVLLARILRVPLKEVDDRYHPPASDPGFVDISGAAIRVDEMTFRRRRFSPGGIAISPHIRSLWSLWSLTMVPCCTETWEYLVDDCTCGTVQGWRHAWRLNRCDRCNRRLDRQTADAVDEPLRDGLGFLVGLLDPDRDKRDPARAMLPPTLADWDGGMVFELALALLPLSPTGYRPRRGAAIPSRDRSEYATALAEAADMVRGWPDTLVPALHAAVTTRSRSRANVRYTGTADYIPALASDMLPPIVRTAIENALAPISAESGSTPHDQIGMMDAAALLGRPLQVLAPARRDGHRRPASASAPTASSRPSTAPRSTTFTTSPPTASARRRSRTASTCRPTPSPRSPMRAAYPSPTTPTSSPTTSIRSCTGPNSAASRRRCGPPRCR